MNQENEKSDLELEILTFKPYLRFRIGDLVTLRADLTQSIVFQIHWIFPFEDYDYKLLGIDGSKKILMLTASDQSLEPYTKQETK